MGDLRKSLNSILSERATSPLYGTLIISWIIWNWKIIYLTLFVSEKKIETDKISYIKEHFSDIHHLLTYPIISSAVLICIIPFISNGAYWLSLKFNKWKIDQKQKIEMKQLLTLEQSIELREEIINQAERFDKLLADKNLEIKQLEGIAKVGSASNSDPVPTIEIDSPIAEPPAANGIDENDQGLVKMAEKIATNEKLMQMYNYLIYCIQAGYNLDMSEITGDFLLDLETLDIVTNRGHKNYVWGPSGKKFYRLMKGL